MATRRGPDNTVRWSVAGTVNGIAWANVFWSRLTFATVPTPAQLDTWLTTVSGLWKTDLGVNCQTTVLTTQAQAILFLPADLVLPSTVAMTGGGGATANAASDQASCGVISWQTGVYWRGGKPRTYLPMPPAAFITGNRALTAGALAANLLQGGLFLTHVNAVTSGPITATQLGFVSFRSGNAERVPPVFFPYTGVKAHGRLGTQRRRLGQWVP